MESKNKIRISDYDLGKVVGQGAYGKVILSRHKQTNQIVAIKQIEKQQIQQVGKTRSVFREKDLLFELDHPFIIKLLGVAQDETLLYFIFENCENGDFADMIAKRNKLSIEVTRIYAAQIVQVLAYLQSKEVMHRDLKPQNMLLDQNMNIKIIDFGDAKKESDETFEEEPQELSGAASMFQEFHSNDTSQERRGTFVGTVNFIAPEMIKECESTCASDLWALGCIIFKMFTGKVPFPGMSETQVFPLILSRKIDWPKGDMDPVVKDLIDKLLQLEPLDRLGCPMTGHDMKSLMRHPFFEGIHFSSDLSKTTDVRALLAESEIQELTQQVGQLRVEQNPTEAKFTIAHQKGAALLEGLLLKKNKWFMKQERLFKLFTTGHLKYFKGSDEKGTMILTKESKARKISKYEVEIFLSKGHKSYVLLQVELASAPLKKDNYSCLLDDWVEAINQVVSYLQKK